MKARSKDDEGKKEGYIISVMPSVCSQSYISMLPVYSQHPHSHTLGILPVMLLAYSPSYSQSCSQYTFRILSVVLSVYSQSYLSFLAFICRLPYFLSSSSFLPSSSFFPSFIFFPSFRHLLSSAFLRLPSFLNLPSTLPSFIFLTSVPLFFLPFFTLCRAGGEREETGVQRKEEGGGGGGARTLRLSPPGSSLGPSSFAQRTL